MAETAEMIYKVNADEHARSILRAHRKWEEVHTTLVNAKARAEAERDAAVAQVAEKDKEIADLLRRLEQYES